MFNIEEREKEGSKEKVKVNHDISIKIWKI